MATTPKSEGNNRRDNTAVTTNEIIILEYFATAEYKTPEINCLEMFSTYKTFLLIIIVISFTDR